MSPIIVHPATVGNIVWVGIVDEVFNLLAVLLIVFTLVLIVDFSFDIEEGSALILATLATAAL